MIYTLLGIDRAIANGQQPQVMQRTSDLNRLRQRIHDAPTLLAGAQFFRARGMLDESLRWIGYAQNAHPSSREQLDIYVNLGAIYRQAGRLPSASEALNKALDIDPDYEPARYNFLLVKAETALGRQEYDTALAAFAELTRIEPNNPLPYYNAAVICDKLPERGEDALIYYRTFLGMTDDEYPQAIRRAQERIRLLTDSLMGSD